MKLFTLITIFILFSPTLKAHAFSVTTEQECSPIDLRTNHPLPIRNQGNISWCFAHAAADYLQFTFQSSTQISAADIAINYANSDLSKIIYFFQSVLNSDLGNAPPQTGFISKAISMTIPEGYCPESIFPSDTWEKVSTLDGSRTHIEVLDAIILMYQLQKQVHQGIIKSANDLQWSLGLNHITPPVFFALLKNSSKATLLMNLRSSVCAGERIPFPDAKLNSKFEVRNEHTFENINASLSNQTPVAIDFFSGIFENYDNYKKTVEDLHTVLLYGRKYDQERGECTYLMKNSYGTACNEYDPKIKCEGGYLWFPEGKIYDTITSEFFMKKL